MSRLPLLLAPLALVGPPEPPVEVAIVPVPRDEPAFVLRGPRGGCPRMVFLHGMCGHGLGYVQSFQFTGHDHGGVLGLQGDVACGEGSPFRRYTADPVRQNERVERAFSAASGPDGPCRTGNDLVLIGYSQGAYLAERMAALFPRRYPRVVLLGAPTTPSPAFLGASLGAVLISGEHDATYRMKDGARALAGAGVPSLYLEMPGARHGEMRDAERIMGEAFAWLAARAR